MEIASVVTPTGSSAATLLVSATRMIVAASMERICTSLRIRVTG
jgi:hypothetical protein